MRLKEINGKYVMPGDDVCVIEEFMPGIGTYEDRGIVKAALIGITQVNMNSRTVSIKPLTKELRLPSRNDVVIGIVVLVKDEYSLVKILTDSSGVKYQTPFTAILHISQVSNKFVRSLYDVVRVGDLVKAKVLNDFIPYNLTIKEPKLGVVMAFCGKCGQVLKPKDNELLTCPICGNSEKRKVSIDYGKIKGLTTCIR